MAPAIQKTFMATLEEYLNKKPYKGFKPTPHYSEEGDCLTFYFKNVASYAERVDELLTVYLSLDGADLVGCQIKSIGSIMKRLRGLRIQVKDRGVELSMLFLACRALAEEPGPLKTYERLFEEVRRRKATLPGELLAA